MRTLTVREATQKRDDALVAVDAGATETWKAEAWAFLLEYMKTHDEVFVDDLWAAGFPEPRELRALGPLFIKAAKEGLMEKTDEYRPSVRSNMNTKVVWRVM